MVSPLCYGAVPFGTAARGAELDRLFGMFLEAGGNFFDTAHCYCFWLEGGMGTSERTLGACVRRHMRREDAVIATKGGHPAMSPGYPRPDAFISPEAIAADLDDSLERLGMAYVDLYYLHRDDPRLPAGEIIEMLNVEVERGRVRYLGASNWSTARIAAANAHAAAHGLRDFVISQPQWSLAQPTWAMDDGPSLRYLTSDDIRWHTATGLPVAAFTSSAGGYFAGVEHEQFNTPLNRARRERARRMAAELGCTPNQVALAYLLCREFPVFPIIGTTNPAHLADAFGATAILLTSEQVHWLAEGSADDG